MALALERADDAQFVLGIDASEHARLLDDRIELGVVHGPHLDFGGGPRPRLVDFQLAAIASAVAGWSPVIITERMCACLATATAATRPASQH